MIITEAKLEAGWLMVKLARDDLGEAMAFIRKMKPKPYEVTIKEHRKKRSKDANAYCWELVSKLAEVMRISPNEVYINAIQNIGGNYEVIPVKEEAAQKFTEVWQRQGIGWPCVDMGKSKIPGYRNLRAYYGSSTYDSRQMGLLIGHIVQDCKALGIETLTPDKLALLEGL